MSETASAKDLSDKEILDWIGEHLTLLHWNNYHTGWDVHVDGRVIASGLTIRMAVNQAAATWEMENT